MKIEKTECSYQVTECDLKFGEQITLDDELLIPISALDKIRAEIQEKFGDYDICEWFEDYDYEENDISEYQHVGDVSDILAIIDKYKAESEG